MGLFKDPGVKKVHEEIERLNKRLAEIRGASEGQLEAHDLQVKVNDLKKQVSDLEIDKSKKTEEFEKRDREIRHKVGLEQSRQKVELDQAKKQASLDVREENLKKDQERFDKHMSFMEDRMTKEVEYVKEIAEKIMERLPHVEALVDAKKRTTKA